MVDGTAAAATVDLRWGGKGSDVGIYAIAPEEAMAAQMPKLTTGAAESVEPPRLSRCAHLRLVLGSSASRAPDSRSRAAVMWPPLLWLRVKQMLWWWMTVLLNLWSSTSIKEPSLLLIVFHHLNRLTFCKNKNVQI